MNKLKKYLKENYKRILLIILIIVGYIGLLFACKYANNEIKENISSENYNNDISVKRRNENINVSNITNSISLNNVVVNAVSSQNYATNILVETVTNNSITIEFEFDSTLLPSGGGSFDIYLNMNLFSNQVYRTGMFNVYYESMLESNYSFYQVVRKDNDDYNGDKFSGTIYTYNQNSNFTLLNDLNINSIQYQLKYMFNNSLNLPSGTYNLTLYFAYYDITSIRNGYENYGYNMGYDVGYDAGVSDGSYDVVNGGFKYLEYLSFYDINSLIFDIELNDLVSNNYLKNGILNLNSIVVDEDLFSSKYYDLYFDRLPTIYTNFVFSPSQDISIVVTDYVSGDEIYFYVQPNQTLLINSLNVPFDYIENIRVNYFNAEQLESIKNYNLGYYEGINIGKQEGIEQGKQEGINIGKQDVLNNLGSYDLYNRDEYLNYGENQKQVGINIGKTSGCSVNNLFFAIADIPTRILSSLLSFELFGINMFVAFGSIATLLLIIWVIRKVK